MGTVIYDIDGLEIKRFWGGNERGVCYQLTRRNIKGEINYVVISQKEVIELLALKVVLPIARQLVQTILG